MFRQQQLYNILADRHILIAGYGREGRSTHSMLKRIIPDQKVDIACNDTEIFAALSQADLNGKPYDLIIKSPGIPTMKFEGRCSPNTITSQTDIFLQIYGDITIGVTGTKGKTTTTTLIHHVLSHSLEPQSKVILAGNMGIPLFDIIDQLDNSCRVVAELSCHQLDNIHQAPHIGIILNLYQEHLDHYHDYRDYQLAKMQMMLMQQPSDHCFYCADSKELLKRVEELRHHIVSTLHPYSLQEAHLASFDHRATPLLGDHNAGNIYVAKRVATLLGISDNQFSAALATFQGLPHRLEKVGTFCGITFYNDSISTIPQSTIAAIEALKNVDTLILGGFDRGIDYSEIEHYITFPPAAGLHIRNIAFVGEAGRRMHSHLLHHPDSPLNRMSAILIEDDYHKIVDWCYLHTAKNSTCLLSPAAASYDSFKNFEERGNTFKELVRNHK